MRLRFGVFELDLQAGELRKAGRAVRLPPQPFQVLALLARRAPEVVTRDEIRREVWGEDTFVDFDQGLNSCIKQIRAALGDETENPQFIETRPRRGYRFVAEVRAVRPRGRRWPAAAAAVVLAAAPAVWLATRRPPQTTAPQARRSPAYEDYIQGRFFWNKRSMESFHKALDCFRRAIENDPVYAPAHTGLADTYSLLGQYYFLPPTEAFPRAREAARQALAIDPNLAEAHTSLGCVRSRFDFDWPAAERSYRRAIDLDPAYATAHQWYAELLATLGRFDQAVAEIRLARQHDPLSLIIRVAAASVYYFGRRYDEVIEECRQTLEMDPGFAPAHQYLAAAYEQKGMYREARAVGYHAARLAELRNAHALVGLKGIGRRRLEQLIRRPQPGKDPSYVVATVYAALGENDKAFEWLERACQERDSTLAYSRLDPSLDNLRSDPRFENLLRRLGLTL